MAVDEKTLDKIHARLGYQRLSRGWAKAEIVLGLIAVGLGLLLGGRAVSRPAIDLIWVAAAQVLFVLGWYLALAGHRSHIYQSMNDQTAILLDEINRGRPPTTESDKRGN